MISPYGHAFFFFGSGEQEKQNLLNEYLGRINKELGYVQLELRACRNQYDGRVYYGIVNIVSDQHSRLGTKYKVPQIAFYKAIVSFFMLSCFFLENQREFLLYIVLPES